MQECALHMKRQQQAACLSDKVRNEFQAVKGGQVVGIAVQRSPVKKSFLLGPLFKTHSILQPFSYLIHFVLSKRKIQSIPHQTGRRCWLQNPWRKAFLPPASDPVSIERGTICLKRSWWLRDPDQAAVLHQVWFIDNPSAYMFLQDNIGFGKPFHIGGGVSSQWKITFGTMIAFPNSSGFDLWWWWFISHNCCFFFTINKQYAP